MCDESLSWGVLGAAGRGVTEHFNLPVSTIHVIIASLAATLGSIGGFCVGKYVGARVALRGMMGTNVPVVGTNKENHNSR